MITITTTFPVKRVLHIKLVWEVGSLCSQPIVHVFGFAPDGPTTPGGRQGFQGEWTEGK
jgi:hypothetical protein